MLDIAASHHGAFSANLATDVLKECTTKKNASALAFRAAIEDLSGMYAEV